MPIDPRIAIRTRLLCGDEIAMGPGKADLLEAIEATGSISAGGRRLGMSYRRTWLLVDAMNRCWREPLVATTTGGGKGGGAKVTPLGREVLRLYRDLTRSIDARCETGPAPSLVALLSDRPRERQQE